MHKFMTENDLATLGSVFLIEVGKIRPNSQQPRTEFDLEKLKDLSESIRQYGVLQPLVVIRKETENENGISVEYELIAGERRLRASKLAGLSQVPVVIRKESDEKTKLELAIIENLQREDLNAIDRAMAFGKLVNDFKLKHHEVATRVGKSREYVSNTIRLLMLPEEIQSGLVKGEVSEGHCRALLALDGKLAIEEGVNAELKSMEKKLADTLGTKVQIEMTGGRGTISINFFSSEELNAFLTRMTAKAEKKTGFEQKSGEKSIDGIMENESAPATSAPVAGKSDFNGAAADPVEELLKNFSL